ncbi:hypothetical protein MLD38_038541 [Melastoma candidum]|uniref:Uncharacterized protein n=1 Tax=Melastoma candidum TaxID=119954 RepID=A0ACB9L0Q4_9MYRT|nr:hypothetical protein MLD38_038541 [Melastoma candidum]
MMDHCPKSSLANISVLSLVVVGILYLYVSSNYPSLGYGCAIPVANSDVRPYDAPPPPADELGRALQMAAKADRTVILTVVNEAYTEQDVNSDKTMLDLFVDSFWLGDGTRHLLDRLLVVAVDRTAYRRCRFRRLNCYRLETEGEGRDEKLYMSEGFVRMMWRRTQFLGEVLRKGYNFIFTDTDVMWLRNPFPWLSNNVTVDLQISTDKFNGDPWSERNPINTGFYFVRSNNRTTSLFDAWYGRKANSTGKKEQDVLIDLMHEGLFQRLGLRVRFLDTDYFSGFCRDSKDFDRVATVHSNCCRSIKAKVFDLSVVLRDWKRYKWRRGQRKVAGGRNGTGSYNRWTPHVGCWRAWRTTPQQKQ